MDLVDKAFKNTPRENFLPAEVKGLAAQDRPLPIGYGQTNSQPSTVRQMLTWLGAQPGEKVLDVGSGSGWTTALLARIVGPGPGVYAVEAIPELVRFGRKNCERLGIKNARFFTAGAAYGLPAPAPAPYNRILVSAAAGSLPPELLEQLAPGGRMVIPVGSSILVVDKTPDGYGITEHPGYAFVPLVKT